MAEGGSCGSSQDGGEVGLSVVVVGRSKKRKESQQRRNQIRLDGEITVMLRSVLPALLVEQW